MNLRNLNLSRLKFDRKHDKEIISMAWPSIVEQILEMMVGIVSMMFMGSLGNAAVAAVGMVTTIMNFIQTVFAGLSIGTTVVIARVTGEANKTQAKQALIQSGYMAIFVGLLLMIMGKIFQIPLIGFFMGGAEAEVRRLGVAYFGIILFNLPCFVLDIIVSGAMRGAGDTKTPMVITGGVNVLNIILNTILIFGVPFLHIPAMGVVGSAIAVTVSRVVGVTVRVLVLYNVKSLKLHLSLKDDYSFKPDLMKRVINIGIPGFIEQAVMQGGFVALQFIIVSMGTVALAAYQIGININAIVFFPIFGFAIANTTLVGQSLGEKDYAKAHTYAYESLKITMLFGFALGILTFTFASTLAGLYTKDAQTIREAILMVRVFGVLEPLLAILNICSATLKASGDIKYVMVTSLIGLWLLRALPSFALDRLLGWGLTAVCIGIILDFSIRSFLYLIRMNKGNWKYLKI
jgi:putative MATE family efflux protein